jgi:hypothetical protein
MAKEQQDTPTRRGTGADDASLKGLVIELARLCIPILIGLAVAVGVHHFFALPRLGFPAEVRRLITIGSSLDTGLLKGDEPVAVIISNSAGVEGIDAAVVQEAAPKGWRVLNFSTNGTNQVEARLLADRLADAGADLVIWLFRPDLLGAIRPMHADVVHAYAEGGFAQELPWVSPPWVDDSTMSQLEAGSFEVSLHFRRRWLDAINFEMRRRMRTGIRAPAADDFEAPFNLEIMLDGSKLDRHLGEISSMMSDELEGFHAEGLGTGRAFVAEMVGDFAKRSAELAIVIAPTHPHLNVQFEPVEVEVLSFLKPLADAKGLRVGSAAGLLEVSQYADAIHPNESGRDKLSRWLGTWMPPPPARTK